jgi:hypothetical protein
MMPLFKRACVVLLLISASACGSGSNSTTSPTPTAPTTVGPSSVTVLCSNTTLTAVGQQTQCSVTVVLSNGISQDQTLASQWNSSNSNVAPVSSTGLVTAVANGSATITATFQGVQGVRAVGVTLPTTFTLTGTLTDGTSRGILPNINIQIVSGTNNGRSAVTDGGGNYTMSGLSAGTFTLSVSAVSYLTTTQQVTFSANTRVDLVLQRVPAPTPAPAPAPGPGPAPGGTALLTITIDPATCFLKVFVATVDVDGSYVAGLGNGQSVNLFVTVGSHVITASAFPLTWSLNVFVPSNGWHEVLTCS